MVSVPPAVCVDCGRFFLLSLKYLPFIGVKRFLILVTDGIRGRLPFRALKSPLLFSHLKVGVWHAMEGGGGSLPVVLADPVLRQLFALRTLQELLHVINVLLHNVLF